MQPVCLKNVKFESSPDSVGEGTTKPAKNPKLAVKCQVTQDSAKIAACLNASLPKFEIGVSKEQVEDFRARGGKIQVLEEDGKIHLVRKREYIVGCNSGMNRSQTHAAYLIKHGLNVKAVLAGGDSAFNPLTDWPIINPPYGENDEFDLQFPNKKKIPQLGHERIFKGEGGKSTLAELQTYYQNYINALAGTHFITYAKSGPSVLHRLLNRPGDLKGFTITYIDWNDEIARPPQHTAPRSQKAYSLMERKLEKHFPISSK
jgi:hypothetical protein